MLGLTEGKKVLQEERETVCRVKYKDKKWKFQSREILGSKDDNVAREIAFLPRVSVTLKHYLVSDCCEPATFLCTFVIMLPKDPVRFTSLAQHCTCGDGGLKVLYNSVNGILLARI